MPTAVLSVVLTVLHDILEVGGTTLYTHVSIQKGSGKAMEGRAALGMSSFSAGQRKTAGFLSSGQTGRLSSPVFMHRQGHDTVRRAEAASSPTSAARKSSVGGLRISSIHEPLSLPSARGC